jgi:hypothetical protein
MFRAAVLLVLVSCAAAPIVRGPSIANSAVKQANAAAGQTDSAMVVALSPNTPVPDEPSVRQLLEQLIALDKVIVLELEAMRSQSSSTDVVPGLQDALITSGGSQ